MKKVKLNADLVRQAREDIENGRALWCCNALLRLDARNELDVYRKIMSPEETTGSQRSWYPNPLSDLMPGLVDPGRIFSLLFFEEMIRSGEFD